MDELVGLFWHNTECERESSTNTEAAAVAADGCDRVKSHARWLCCVLYAVGCCTRAADESAGCSTL